MRRVDAHQHFWSVARGDYGWLTPDLAPIYRDFGPADLKPLLVAGGIEGTILVQAAESTAETAYLLSIAEAEAMVLGVVGWVDMAAPDAPEALARLARHPKLVGIRPMLQDLPDPDWMLRPELELAFRAIIDLDLVFDALIRPRHLSALRLLLARYPDLRCVIDHAAKPEIREGRWSPWAEQMALLAAETSACCKLSGLVTEAASDWAPADIRPYAELVLERFGPSRTLFGSDWPVLTLAAGYADWLSLACDLTAFLDDADRARVFGGTAERVYLKG